MRSELISRAKLHTLASLCGLNIYLQKTFYFLVLQRNIKLKTSKHEFTDISDQNKQGFEGKKLSRTGFTAFEENLFQTLPTRGIEGKDSYCFRTSIFAFVLLVILQNPSKQFA